MFLKHMSSCYLLLSGAHTLLWPKYFNASYQYKLLDLPLYIICTHAYLLFAFFVVLYVSYTVYTGLLLTLDIHIFILHSVTKVVNVS